MAKTLTAVFDGKVLVPDEPAGLDENERYELTVSESVGEVSIWDVLDRHSGTIEMPEDWALEHDHHIHGAPKRYSNEE
jgi:hypothetical protein